MTYHTQSLNNSVPLFQMFSKTPGAKRFLFVSRLLRLWPLWLPTPPLGARISMLDHKSRPVTLKLIEISGYLCLSGTFPLFYSSFNLRSIIILCRCNIIIFSCFVFRGEPGFSHSWRSVSKYRLSDLRWMIHERMPIELSGCNWC